MQNEGEDAPFEPREIQLRAYTRREPHKAPKARDSVKKQPSARTLIFDTETIGVSQRLRIGSYQLRDDNELFEEGLFYDPAALFASETELLQSYARDRGLVLRTDRDFVEEVFFEECHELHGTCVGFNLPFDLSRLALAHGTAKGGKRNELFQKAFSLQLSENEKRPRLKVKHLSSRSAFMEFAMVSDPNRRSDKKRGRKVEHHKGFFVDVKTLAGVLLAANHSLRSLAKALGLDIEKGEVEDFEAPLTTEFLDYTVQDVRVTWKCYRELIGRLSEHGLPNAPAYSLTSEASLGKSYLRAMGLKPWMVSQPDFPPEMIGIILSTYYGGRSEVHIRREVCEAFYCDFLSMYPTVNTVMGLWQFATAEGINYQDATESVRDILETWTLGDLQKPENWPKLTAIVQVMPDDDIFPIRAIYGDAAPRHEKNKVANIGLNRLTCEAPLWFTLADCLASKLLNGKPPKVVKAYNFTPMAQQSGLRVINLAGDPETRIDPAKDDFFREVITRRKKIAGLKKAAKSERDREHFDGLQLALKILANATSYGIFVELNVHDAYTETEEGKRNTPKAKLARYGYDGTRQEIISKVEETPGEFFHPLLATLITGAARLMLALSERAAADQGLDWIFCDTDGIAFAKPDEMSSKTFQDRIDAVRGWFEPLNPYAFEGSILQAEDENFSREKDAAGNKQRLPLFAYAVSAKRYALFNKNADGSIDLRKTSAHGLGLYVLPYEAPPESGWKKNSKSEFWHEQVWERICLAALNGEDDKLNFVGIEGFNKPAASRYAATKPNLLEWFADYNQARDYPDQIRPFTFMLSFQLDEMEFIKARNAGDAEALAFASDPRPASPYETDVVRAATRAFDRTTGQSVRHEWLRTYESTLAGYHLRDEAKFLGGVKTQRGALKRRHIDAFAIQQVGKEAHDWEEIISLGETNQPSRQVAEVLNWDKCRALIARAQELHGVRNLRYAAGVGDAKIRSILRYRNSVEPDVLRRLVRAVYVLGDPAVSRI
ncbi:hypothetical protein [Henriciella marina]|uniref:hypothetical protein n=1 Tax=Henriciella marina TaxID=453851 RepID=UPI0003616570|nr:hypothetical protein [Henriciella marina]